ncbi:MAG: family polyphosphate--nucleotide phosphotransferase [Actinotalea sp.]|nr:family polyphosphate--nucleotide phosphotransferase [Actinotalea sp.]
MASKDPWTTPPHEALRAGPGFDLAGMDRGATPGWSGGSTAAENRMARRGAVLSELQEKLFAHGRSDGTHAVLLVLQGMDTAGKGGIVRHVIGMVDPQGVALRSFGVPKGEEVGQHYLWRIRRALPKPGHIGVFDRSHYEDVLAVRVERLVTPAVWEPRFEEINQFEEELVAGGMPVVKVALMVSEHEQAKRLRRRLERPDKHWKYSPADIDARARWPLYQEAYQAVLDRTSTQAAPWYVVPADHKWYARLAVTELMVRALDSLELDWPPADFDVRTELARLAAVDRRAEVEVAAASA